jgi:hypothetical protein
LDLITLANNTIKAAMLIDAGRKGFATRGKEQEGRISYEDGIAKAMSAFQEDYAPSVRYLNVTSGTVAPAFLV